MFYSAGDFFVVVAPTINNQNVKYYFMRFTERKMNLLENYDDNGFRYDRGSLMLKGYFFQQTHQSGDFVYFQDYESDVISFHYSHLVRATCVKLIEVKSKKKINIKKWKM